VLKVIFAFQLLSVFPIHNLFSQGCQNPYPNNCPNEQKQANRWYFGEYAGLDFNQNPVLVMTDNTVIKQLEGNACISDSTGNFIMSTGGSTKLSIWNGLFQPLASGFNLLGNVSATQSSLIIPDVNPSNRYHVFALNLPADHPAYENGLSYSLIDISPPLYTANILVENKVLVPRVSEKISAVKHRNGKDIWVVVHEWNSRAFFAYLITAQGLIESPVISDAGELHEPMGNDVNQAIGQMKIAPTGNRLALAIYGKNLFEIFDFNNETGVVQNAITSQAEYSGAYGIEFSPDGNFLYGSTVNVDGSITFPSSLVQFNVKAGLDIFETGVEVDMNMEGSYFCGLQLGPDGKIYVARSPEGSNYLGVIHNPRRPGLECNFNAIDNVTNSGLFLEGKQSKFSLPGFNQSYFCIPKFTYQFNCHGDVTTFSIVNRTNVDSVRWICENLFSTKEFEPTYQFSSPGNYTVKLTDYFNGIGYTEQLKGKDHFQH